MSAKKAKKEQGQAIIMELKNNRELREKQMEAEREANRMAHQQHLDLMALFRLQAENQAKELEVRRLEAQTRIATGNLDVAGPFPV